MTVGFDKSAVDSGAADKSAVDKHTEELIDESLHEKQKQPDGLVSTNSRRMAGLLVCLVVLAAVLLLSIAVGIEDHSVRHRDRRAGELRRFQ